MENLFLKYEDEFLKFDRIEHKMSKRPDIHAFLLIDVIVPGDSDIVSDAEHDVIYLSVNPFELVRAATDDQMRDLHRCGVRYDSYHEALAMFT